MHTVLGAVMAPIKPTEPTETLTPSMIKCCGHRKDTRIRNSVCELLGADVVADWVRSASPPGDHRERPAIYLRATCLAFHLGC